MTHQKSFRDFEIGSKVSEIHDFLGTIRHPLMSITMAVLLRYNSWYISLPSSAKQQP